MTGELCHGADHDHGTPDPATVGVLSSLVASDGPQRVALGSLRPADSPRLDGERIDHVQMLAEAGADLPPILVHRPTMRVIDGMHRLRAAQSRGAEAVEVQFLDGTEELAFAAAVRANVVHGLPLSRRDREAAVLRILGSHAMWSNRTIATIVGLGPSTVGTIRRQQPKQAPVRIGRDGRIRPLSTTEGRRRAAEVIAERPGTSLREVARLAGISTGTVRDVRRRLAQGEGPVPLRRSGGRDDCDGVGAHVHRFPNRAVLRDRDTILRNLRSDPSLRFSQAGRDALRWLGLRSQGPDGWEKALDRLPPHCAFLVAELADRCSERWLVLAGRLRAQEGQAAGQ